MSFTHENYSLVVTKQYIMVLILQNHVKYYSFSKKSDNQNRSHSVIHCKLERSGKKN